MTMQDVETSIKEIWALFKETDASFKKTDALLPNAPNHIIKSVSETKGQEKKLRTE